MDILAVAASERWKGETRAKNRYRSILLDSVVSWIDPVSIRSTQKDKIRKVFYRETR